MKQAVRPLNRLIWRPAASPAALNGRHGAARAFSATRPTLRTDDLSGILVVSIDQAVAAPYCAMRLADMGARVIKVERPDGDFARKYDKFVKDQSAYFLWLNRGKESIALDFKNPDDMAVLKNMISKADVFIQNLAPGATKRMGLGSAELRKQFPRLITCDISGYGEDGPYRDLKAYDMLIQAETGLATITGAPEGGPARAGISICDISAGVTSLTAILQALYARDVRTGKGRGIEVSLFHSLADWMNAPYLQYAYGGYTPARAGLHHPTIAPYGSYACGDGKSVLIAVQNEREWVSLCSNVFKRPEMAIDERFKSMVNRVANRPALDEIILEIMAWFPREHWCAELEKAKIAYGRLSSMEDLKNHPQAKFMTVKSTEGNVEVKMMTPGALLKGITEDGADGKEVLDFGPVPALNEHGAKIRSEFS
ncbi:CoA-transferase family III domain-containing protein [Hyaloraphidium curvatum]|nr:CoA-transferase family III domain-containing protein [Hyaloraphidium curvatum]